MNRLNRIVQVSVIVSLLSSIVFLFVPGWKLSVGILIGVIIGIGDFFMIIKTMSMLNLAGQDPKIMLKFVLMFMIKMVVLLVVLGAVIFVLSVLRAKLTLFGFIGGLAIVPVSIFISAFFKEEK